MRALGPGPGRDVALAVSATVCASLPVFLVGAVAVQLRESLRLGAGEFGVVVSLYYLGAGLASIPLGAAVEALGGARTMRLATGASATLLLLIAVVARSGVSLALLLLLAGVSSAAMGPATNLFLARRVVPARQGLAFGFKQAAVPTATALAGLAVPALVLTVGWRWAFAAGALAAGGALTLLPRPRQTLASRRAARVARPPLRRAPLLVLAAGFGLGIATASALTAFLVSSAVAAGMGHAAAGLLATLGGAAAALSRIVTGYRADVRGRAHFPVVAAMLGVGALGYLALAAGAASHLAVLFVLAVVVVFAAGWGWNGLFNFAVVRTHDEHAARATGLTQAGGRLGGVVGPVAFGQLVAHGSYALAWTVSGGAAGVAAAVMLLGRGLLIRSRQPPA